MNIDLGTEASYNRYIPFNVKIIMKTAKGCKDIYKLLNSKNVTPISQGKWNRIFENVKWSWKDIYIQYPSNVVAIPKFICFNIE